MNNYDGTGERGLGSPSESDVFELAARLRVSVSSESPTLCGNIDQRARVLTLRSETISTTKRTRLLPVTRERCAMHTEGRSGLDIGQILQ